MQIRNIIFILSSLFIFYVPVVAQGLLGKSQFLIAYESKAAFLGEVVFIGEKPEGFYTSGEWSQTAIFKVKKQLKGKITSKFVAISIAVTGDLQGSIFEKNEYIVFLSDHSGGGNSFSCGNFELDSKNSKFKVLSNTNQPFKMPCFSVDELRNIVEGTKEEITAITVYLKFLAKNKKRPS
jgi:hypothetical protein